MFLLSFLWKFRFTERRICEGAFRQGAVLTRDALVKVLLRPETKNVKVSFHQEKNLQRCRFVKLWVYKAAVSSRDEYVKMSFFQEINCWRIRFFKTRICQSVVFIKRIIFQGTVPSRCEFIKVPFHKERNLLGCHFVKRRICEGSILRRDEFLKVPRNGTKFVPDISPTKLNLLENALTFFSHALNSKFWYYINLWDNRMLETDFTNTFVLFKIVRLKFSIRRISVWNNSWRNFSGQI